MTKDFDQTPDPRPDEATARRGEEVAPGEGDLPVTADDIIAPTRREDRAGGPAPEEDVGAEDEEEVGAEYITGVRERQAAAGAEAGADYEVTPVDELPDSTRQDATLPELDVLDRTDRAAWLKRGLSGQPQQYL